MLHPPSATGGGLRNFLGRLGGAGRGRDGRTSGGGSSGAISGSNTSGFVDGIMASAHQLVFLGLAPTPRVGLGGRGAVGVGGGAGGEAGAWMGGTWVGGGTARWATPGLGGRGGGRYASAPTPGVRGLGGGNWSGAASAAASAACKVLPLGAAPSTAPPPSGVASSTTLLASIVLSAFTTSESWLVESSRWEALPSSGSANGITPSECATCVPKLQIVVHFAERVTPKRLVLFEGGGHTGSPLFFDAQLFKTLLNIYHYFC